MVLDQVVRRIWQDAAAPGTTWEEGEEGKLTERKKRTKASFDLPTNRLSASSSSDDDDDARDRTMEGQQPAEQSPRVGAGAHDHDPRSCHSAAKQSQQISRSRAGEHQRLLHTTASPSSSARGLATNGARGGGGGDGFQNAGVAPGSGLPWEEDEGKAQGSHATSPADMAGEKQVRNTRSARETNGGFEFDAFPAEESIGGQLIKRVLQNSPLIVVLDGVASPSLHRAVCDAFAEPSMWSWGHTSLGNAMGARHEAPFWKCNQETLGGCKAVQALSDLVARLASQVTGKALETQRLYANGHTSGQGGSMHVDEHGTENYAAIYYANAEWRPEWMGHTHYLPGTMRDLRGQAGENSGMRQKACMCVIVKHAAAAGEACQKTNRCLMDGSTKHPVHINGIHFVLLSLLHFLLFSLLPHLMRHAAEPLQPSPHTLVLHRGN